MSGPTWDDGELTEEDVIESSDHTGYTSPFDFDHGVNGHEPDDYHHDDDHDDEY
ncbi:hypothetical protein ABGB12_32240 [Actinocorallia sp. B10E7]|uniref:hypothetical protein n=1 Tax=Actinocorallia sp. B10E7 TaxID=3153558 RepID=UPI00325C5F5B